MIKLMVIVRKETETQHLVGHPLEFRCGVRVSEAYEQHVSLPDAPAHVVRCAGHLFPNADFGMRHPLKQYSHRISGWPCALSVLTVSERIRSEQGQCQSSRPCNHDLRSTST